MPLIEEDHITNITHEAETQRQYIRIEMPAVVSINNHICKLLNLSMGGFRVLNAAAVELYNAGQQDITIQFDFNAFSFTIQAQAMPMHSKKDEVAYRFVNLSVQQASLIRHVIRSYLSGQIFTMDSLLNVAARDHTAVERGHHKEETHSWLRIGSSLFPVALIACALIFMLWLLGSNIYEAQRFVKATSSFVEGDVFTMRAVDNGTFYALLPAEHTEITIGEKIARIKGLYGTKTLTGPCDCSIVQTSAKDGEFKLMGEALFKFLPHDADLFIMSLVGADQVQRLKIGDVANVRLQGEKQTRTGRLAQFLPQDSGFVKLKIRLDAPLSPVQFGKPAVAEIATF